MCCCMGNCGEACDQFCPCISIYPSLCTAFLSLVIAAVFVAVFGVYSFVSLRISIFRFSWSPGWLVIVNAAVLALIVAGVLLALSLLLWFTCSSERKGKICKGFYLFALGLVILALGAVMIGSIFLIYGASKDNTAFATALEEVWMEEVFDTNSTLPCRVQKQLSCRGFEEGDCQKGSPTANFSRCGVVCRDEDVEGGKPEFGIVVFPGCRKQMSRFYTQWNAVLFTGTCIACILVLVAFFVTCTSISFDDEK